MATYPEYDFTDPNLDYNDVLNTVKRMYSDINAQVGCCKTPSLQNTLCEVDGSLQAVKIDSDSLDEVRFKADVKEAYDLLSGFFRLSVDVSPIVPVPFPDDALSEINRGLAYFSNLHEEYRNDRINGCRCQPSAYMCLKRIMRSLVFKNELNEYDDIAKKLIDEMLIIIGSFVPVPLARFYYGRTSDGHIPFLSEILASPFIEALSGSNPVIPFDTLNNDVPAFYFMAEFLLEPLKAKWQDTVIIYNRGNIGSGQDLFGVNVNVVDFRIYNTVYATQFSYPIEFIVGTTPGKLNQTITFPAISTKFIGDPDFSANAVASSALPVILNSSNPSVATIVGGLIHITGVGSATITATQPGNTQYNPATPVSRVLNVNPVGSGLPYVLPFTVY